MDGVPSGSIRSLLKIDIDSMTGTSITVNGVQMIKENMYDNTEYVYLSARNAGSPYDYRFMKLSMNTGVVPWNYRIACETTSCTFLYANIELNQDQSVVYFTQDVRGTGEYVILFGVNVATGSVSGNRYLTNTS